MKQDEEVEVMGLRVNNRYLLLDVILKKLPRKYWYMKWYYIIFGMQPAISLFNIKPFIDKDNPRGLYGNGIIANNKVFILIHPEDKIEDLKKDSSD